MIRTYYQDIFEALETDAYDKAADSYVRLAKRMARRNDYNSASFMLLLMVLTQNASGLSIQENKTSLNKILDKMGIVKKILVEHFGIKIAYFVLDSLQSKDPEILQKGKNILGYLPFLQPEKKLIPFS